MKKYVYYLTNKEVRLISKALANLNYDGSNISVDEYYKEITELQNKLLRGVI